MTKFLAWIGLYKWLLVAGAVTVGYGGAVLWHNTKVKQARADGESTVRQQYAAAENRALIVQSERIATLTTELTEAASEKAEADKNLAVAVAAAYSRGRGVRNAIATNDLDSRLEAATCEVRRSFASRAFRAAGACRDDLAEIGLGTGGLVESSAAAHSENKRADALMRFVMPSSPFTKAEK